MTIAASVSTAENRGPSNEITRGPLQAAWRPLLLIFAVRLTQVLLAAAMTFGRETDIPFFFALAEQSAQGRYPFVHFWVEYPPVFPWLVVGIYGVAGAVWPGDLKLGFSVLLVGFNLVAESGSLILVYLLAKRLNGPGHAFRAGLAYALLFPPVRFAMFGMIEPLAELLLLSSLYLGLARRELPAGLLSGLGLLTKVYPAVAIPALALLYPGSKRWRLLAAFVALPILAASLLLIASPAGVLGSVKAIGSRPAWESPYALFERCCAFGKLDEPSGRGLVPPDEPVSERRLPWLVISIVFAAVYLTVTALRRRPVDERAAAALTLFGVAMLLLWSRGFSPQFTQWLLPLLLIVLRGRAGLLLALGLTVLVFVEYIPAETVGTAALPLYLVMVWGRWLLSLAAAVLAARLWLGGGTQDGAFPVRPGLA